MCACSCSGSATSTSAEFAGAARAARRRRAHRPDRLARRRELQCAYAATDVFVTPSICFDTFGLVNLEAMEHRKPVVATVFGGSREVLEHGVTGFVENPFDVAAYAGRIGVLLADPALRARQGEAGYVRLRERFTIERLAQDFLEEYGRARELAAAAQGAPGTRCTIDRRSWRGSACAISAWGRFGPGVHPPGTRGRSWIPSSAIAGRSPADRDRHHAEDPAQLRQAARPGGSPLDDPRDHLPGRLPGEGEIPVELVDERVVNDQYMRPRSSATTSSASAR
jgi:hypothetical protein